MSSVILPDRARRTEHPPRRRYASAMSRSQARWGWLFAGPAAIGFVVFTSGPMIASLVIGMTDWTIGLPPVFVGADNYAALVRDPLFWQSLRATSSYALVAIPGSVLVALLMALLLNRARHASGVFRTIFYLPVLVPPVASAIIWLFIYAPDGGLANIVLTTIGLPPSRWIYDESTAIPSVALTSIWAFGNMTLIFLAAIRGVPKDLLEAAEVDGAGTLARLRHVTIPQISPIILFNLVTGSIAAFQVFDVAFIMTDGGPNFATYFYVFYLYQEAFTDANLGYASALAWVLFLLVLIVTVLIFRTARHWVFYEGQSR